MELLREITDHFELISYREVNNKALQKAISLVLNKEEMFPKFKFRREPDYRHSILPSLKNFMVFQLVCLQRLLTRRS